MAEPQEHAAPLAPQPPPAVARPIAAQPRPAPEAKGDIKEEVKEGILPPVVAVYGPTYSDKEIDSFLVGLQGEAKEDAKAVLKSIIALNGEEREIAPGTPRVYINPSEFFQYIPNAHRIPLLQAYELALNFVALGKGVAGFCGAMVRRSLRDYFSTSRECTTHAVPADMKSVPASWNTALKEFRSVAENPGNQTLAAILARNAQSIAAQAAANMFSRQHHWNAASTREYKALFAALGIDEKVDTLDIRPIVYLSIHPIRLDILELFRQSALGREVTVRVEDKHLIAPSGDFNMSTKGYVPSVVLRCGGTPAGSAAFAVSAIGLEVLKSESYGNRLIASISSGQPGGSSYEDFMAKARDLKENGINYHVMARDYNVDKRELEVDRFTPFLVLGTAYIIRIAKGSLARSAAIAKFRANHQRVVDTWMKRFQAQEDGDAQSIEEYLESSERKDGGVKERIRKAKSEKAAVEAELEVAKLKAQVAHAAGPAGGEDV